MTETSQSSREDTDEEYSRSEHLEKYGLAQHTMKLQRSISVKWSGSARDLIRSEIYSAWAKAEPRGCALAAFERTSTVVKLTTVPAALALYAQITDELYRRRIDGRQRNSLHNARDQLEEAFEEQAPKLKERTNHYNGNQFREKGQVPEATFAKSDIELGSEPQHEMFTEARFRHHVDGHYNDLQDPDEGMEAKIEAMVDRLPLMFGYSV